MSQANNNLANDKFDLEQLVTLTKELTAVITEETEFLKLMQISSIADLQIKKHAIAAELEKQQRALKENPEIKASLSDETKLELKTLALEFDAALQTYQKQLFKAKKINQMIIAKMMELVNDHVLEKPCLQPKWHQNLEWHRTC